MAKLEALVGPRDILLNQNQNLMKYMPEVKIKIKVFSAVKSSTVIFNSIWVVSIISIPISVFA
jgi:hypothetical protein